MTERTERRKAKLVSRINADPEKRLYPPHSSIPCQKHSIGTQDWQFVISTSEQIIKIIIPALNSAEGDTGSGPAADIRGSGCPVSQHSLTFRSLLFTVLINNLCFKLRWMSGAVLTCGIHAGAGSAGTSTWSRCGSRSRRRVLSVLLLCERE